MINSVKRVKGRRGNHVTAGSWDGKSGHTSVKRRQLKNIKETRMSNLRKAAPGEGTGVKGPVADISLVLEENANPIGNGWQEQGLERQEGTKPCKTLRPTVMQLLWKVKVTISVCIFKLLWHYLQSTSRLGDCGR